MSLDDEEQSLRFEERQSNYRGSAKIKLKHLQFDTTAFVDPKNVARLTQIFEIEGCHRLDLEHHVPAIINDRVLQSNLRLSNITGADLMRNRIPPKLKLPKDVKINCLHGKHRIAAANSFLYLPDDKWWTVDLYSDRLSGYLCRDIREDYANSRNFCDGDIFQQIRYCQKRQDHAGEGRWFARLSECKRKDVKQLQKRKELQPLASALDELLSYVGFWPALQIGTFHRVLNLKCPEELRHYLHHIRDYWDKVLDGNSELRPLVDFRTVQLLQTRNPWASTMDNEVINDLMRDHMLFPLIPQFRIRSRILRNIQTTDCIIPSLYTFFEDTKWLEPCAKALRCLLPTNCRKSTHQSMLRNYHGTDLADGLVPIQQKNLRFSHQAGSELEAVECGYRQLWLFAWRHFPELSAMLPRKDVGKPKPRPTASNEQCWQRFARLARSLGFESDNIERLQLQDTDAAMALEFIRRARPDDLFQVPDETRTASVLQICHILHSMEWQMNKTSGESESRQSSEISTQYRCGRPYGQSYRDSKSRFFHSDVYATKTRTLTHFTINRDIFHAFFGPEPYIALEPADTGPDMDLDTETGVDLNTETDMDLNTGNAQPVTMTEAAQPLGITEITQPDVSPMSERPEYPEGQQAKKASSGPLSPEAANTYVESTGKELVPWRDLTTAQLIVDTWIAEVEQQPLIIPQENEGRLQTQRANAPEATASSEAKKLREMKSVQKVDPEATYIFDEWEKRCKTGDIFAVLVYDRNWEHYSREPASETDLGRGNLPEELKQKAAKVYFAAYVPEKKSVKCIKYGDVLKYAMDAQHDGVIYLLRRVTDEGACKEIREADRARVTNESFQNITGDSTKARLFSVVRRLLQKRGRLHGLEHKYPKSYKPTIEERQEVEEPKPYKPTIEERQEVEEEL